MSIIRYESEDRFWKTEDDDGEWVLYKDHIEEIEKLKEKLAFEKHARKSWKVEHDDVYARYEELRKEVTILMKMIEKLREMK